MSANLPTVIAAKDDFPNNHDLTILLHARLDGSGGSNRNRTPNAARLIGANTDIEAIEAWLKAKKRQSPNTQRAYRREAYRLLAWAVAFKEKPVSSLTVEDVADFHGWLLMPENHPEWTRRGWVLIRGPLQPGSARQAMVILSGMFRWLVEAGYLAGNPFRLFDDGVTAKEKAEEAEVEIEHVFDKELWDWILRHIDTYRPFDPASQEYHAFERIRFILVFLYWTGLRRHELVSVTMNRIARERGQWILRVKGKGRKKLEPVVLLPPAMEALHRYRLSRSLPGFPMAAETEVPLIAAHRGNKSITDNYLNTLLKRLFKRLADDIRQVNENWAEKLEAGTAHWIRHTLATHNAEAGVPMQDTADQLRHRSMDTTRRIYTHVKRLEKREKGLSKLLDYDG
ncbi:MAG: tyrosine-type recombinase/integrase [Azoarcus sp.]|jgi:integrase|nr:tyrosine-type recombinase/integrase [Azoarcus sp.]